jgi:hypothetical protein
MLNYLIDLHNVHTLDLIQLSRTDRTDQNKQVIKSENFISMNYNWINLH